MPSPLSRLSQQRTPVALLAVSAVAAAAWIVAEGFSPRPYVPTQGDVPTIGHGSTHYEGGTRVQMSDPPITRQRARELALGELDRTYAACVRNSLPDALTHQAEFDVAVDFAGQFGCRAWANSSMRVRIAAGDYRAACDAYLPSTRSSTGYRCELTTAQHVELLDRLLAVRGLVVLAGYPS
ncbi:lysozyme, partial [Ottowia sp.]|uniref:lysozyme n=1 Tax=Ottowia sp. TaxID=1898956 RepID=UPI0039E55606